MDFQKLTSRSRRFALAARLVGVPAFMLEHGPAIGAAGGSCQSLAMLSLPDTTITLAEPVGEGAFTPPASGRGAPMPYRDLPAFCRVALTVKPTSDSAINIEVWLPAAWNGRLVNGAVVRSRPLCPYPQVAAYIGSGSTDEAASFTCKVQ